MEYNAKNRQLYGHTGDINDAIGIMNIPMNPQKVFFIFNNDSKDYLEEWAIWLNSPWSQTDAMYKIQYNCIDSYTQRDPKWPEYRCDYTVIGYDGYSATIFGWGKTEIESLTDCLNRFNSIQKLYNPKGESI